VDGLPGYGDERHVGRVGAQPRRGGHDRSCRGHRSDGEVVRPWYRKYRQGNVGAVHHTHRVLPFVHAEGSVRNLLHACHKTREAECDGDSRHDGGCNHEGDRGGRSNRHRERAGNRHHGGPWASVNGTCRDRDHRVHPGLHKEP
jgi:hypothetical protein